MKLRRARKLRYSETTKRTYVVLRAPPATNRRRPVEFSLDHVSPRVPLVQIALPSRTL